MSPSPQAMRAAAAIKNANRLYHHDAEEVAAIIDREMSGWRPIAEAPRDGTLILIASHINQPGFVAVGWWSRAHQYFQYTGALPVMEHNLSHFMPLPTPPSAIAHEE